MLQEPKPPKILKLASRNNTNFRGWSQRQCSNTMISVINMVNIQSISITINQLIVVLLLCDLARMTESWSQLKLLTQTDWNHSCQKSVRLWYWCCMYTVAICVLYKVHLSLCFNPMYYMGIHQEAYTNTNKSTPVTILPLRPSHWDTKTSWLNLA